MMKFSENDNSSEDNIIALKTGERLMQTLEEALDAFASGPKSNLEFLEYAEAFLIFAKYPAVHYQTINAEHDEIWSGPTDTSAISTEDIERLNHLGWHESDVGGFHRFV
jgi:hypothetical protein